MTEITVSDKNSTDKLITDLFTDNVVADVRTYKQAVTKSWDKHGHIIVDDGEHVLVMVVSDDRMKDLQTSVEKSLNLQKFDLVFIPVSTANRNYIDFVNDHTITRQAAIQLRQEEKEQDLDDIDESSPDAKAESKEAAKAA